MAKRSETGRADDVGKARELFPRGLSQPDAFRFSLDSLLLASFLSLPKGVKPLSGLDLGAGCGVVGLALLLREARANPGRELFVTGLERNPDMVRCAGSNASVLGFELQYKVVQCDITSYEHSETVDFVLANPPYRPTGTGRESADQARNTARFEAEQGLDVFARAAAQSLKAKGRFALVHLAERLDAVLAGLNAAGLTPKRLRLVHGRADKAARLALVEARKGGGPGLAVEPPLVLYAGEGGGGPALTADALAFCPFLECNASREGSEPCRRT